MPWRKGNRLHLVSESEASGQIAQAFGEVKDALGIGYVPLAFQAFAAYPKFLEVQRQSLRPLLGTREFFELAARLRAEAFTYVHNYFKVPDLGQGYEASQAAPVVEQVWKTEAAVLLLMTVQMVALDGPVGVNSDWHPADAVSQSPAPAFVLMDDSPAPIRRAIDELRLAARLPYCSDHLRAVAQWPDLLMLLGHALKPAMQSIFYEQAVLRVRESAWTSAQEIPLQIELDYQRLTEAGLASEEIATLTRLSDMLVRGSAISLLNGAFLKIGLEGGNTAIYGAPQTEGRVA